MRQRTVVEQLHARHATDGDGVNLLRVFGGGTTLRRMARPLAAGQRTYDLPKWRNDQKYEGNGHYI